MGLSLQEQLLKAGLVNEKQVKKAQHDQRVQNKKNKKKKGGAPTQPNAEQKLKQRRAQQAEQDRQHNEQRRQQEQRKADQASAKQMIEANRQPLKEGDEAYHYVDANGQIERIYITGQAADQLADGKMGLALFDGEIVLIPAETVVKVLARDKESIVSYNDPSEVDEYPEQW